MEMGTHCQYLIDMFFLGLFKNLFPPLRKGKHDAYHLSTPLLASPSTPS